MDSGITIVCREVDRNTGKIASYVCKRDADDHDLFCCGIRACVNPELRYFAVRTCVTNDPELLEDMLSFLKRKSLSDEALRRYGGIVGL